MTYLSMVPNSITVLKLDFLMLSNQCLLILSLKKEVDKIYQKQCVPLEQYR